jgi:hypothetical protein
MEEQATGYAPEGDARRLRRASIVDAIKTEKGPTRIEEATRIAQHAVQRVNELVALGRELADQRLGPQPLAAGANGGTQPAPKLVGTAHQLEAELRTLHHTIDVLTSELQRFREL